MPGLYGWMMSARLTALQPNTSYALYVNGFEKEQKFYRREALGPTLFLRTRRGHVMPVVQHMATAGRIDDVARTFAHSAYLSCPGAPLGRWSTLGEDSRGGLPGGARWWSVD
eukprot:gene38351-40656_t